MQLDHDPDIVPFDIITLIAPSGKIIFDRPIWHMHMKPYLTHEYESPYLTHGYEPSHLAHEYDSPI